MHADRIKAVTVAAVAISASVGAAAGDPSHRFSFLSTRINFLFAHSSPAGDRYAIDGLAFVADGTSGTIYRCKGRISLQQSDPKTTTIEPRDVTAEPLDCGAVAYDPKPDPSHSDFIFAPQQTKMQDERADLSFFRLSRSHAAIAFCTTVDVRQVRCSPEATLR